MIVNLVVVILSFSISSTSKLLFYIISLLYYIYTL